MYERNKRTGLEEKSREKELGDRNEQWQRAGDRTHITKEENRREADRGKNFFF